MAQLNNLIVNGTIKSIGKVTAPEFKGSLTGNATSANKLNTDAGSATQPVYFSNGIPVKTTYTLGASVPSGAKFTDTVYTLPDATTSVKGGVKVGSNLTVSSGTLSLTKANVTSALGYTPPTSNTDTHYTTGLKVGASATATSNAAATNGNVYINALDNTTIRDSHNIVGSGATTVTSDANGKITISSTNTTYSSLKNPNAITISLNGTSQGAYDGSAAKSINITASSVGAAAASHSHSYLPLSGGTMTGAISKAGVSSTWVAGRTNAMLKMTAISGQTDSMYVPALSMKSCQGSWDVGPYSGNKLHFSYITDTNFNAGSNSQTADIYFSTDGGVCAKKFITSTGIEIY